MQIFLHILTATYRFKVITDQMVPGTSNNPIFNHARGVKAPVTGMLVQAWFGENRLEPPSTHVSQKSRDMWPAKRWPSSQI